ncbi:hypothetical protein TURU_011148 [Turdus rufiventris]|nr:hypothetical protein TURU_011148 [Turdus rufiventris]
MEQQIPKDPRGSRSSSPSPPPLQIPKDEAEVPGIQILLSRIPESQDSPFPDPEAKIGCDDKIPQDWDPPFPDTEGRVPSPRGSEASSPNPMGRTGDDVKIPNDWDPPFPNS